MVTSLSHDIRTPLTSLIGYLEVLENESLTPIEQEEFLKVAKRKSLDLSSYIQSLFEWLKLESGEWVYHMEKENICEQTRIILADWIIRLESKNIAFQFDIPEEAIFLTIDKNAYERVISNIFSNIIKHSNATSIHFSLHHEKNNVVIKIYDNGIGIAEDDLPFIFDRLYKCDTSRNENSNGLGLAIAKELIIRQNGHISVESKVDFGTTFIINFSINNINMNKE